MYSLTIIDGDGRERKYTLNKYSQVVSKIKMVHELCDIKSFTCTNNQLGLDIKEKR